MMSQCVGLLLPSLLSTGYVGRRQKNKKAICWLLPTTHEHSGQKRRQAGQQPEQARPSLTSPSACPPLPLSWTSSRGRGPCFVGRVYNKTRLDYLTAPFGTRHVNCE